MDENDLNHPPENHPSQKYRNFLIFSLVIITPLLYVFIISILSWIRNLDSNPPSIENPLKFPFSLNLIFIICLILSVGIIFTTNGYLLHNKFQVFSNQDKKGTTKSFFKIFLIFSLNELINVMALIVGIISWIRYDISLWWRFFGLWIPGTFELLYLYLKKLPDEFRRFSFTFP